MAFIYDLTDTWNAGGTTFNAIKMNVTDSASAAASKLFTLQVGGSERFSVRKDGQGYFAGNVGIGIVNPSEKLLIQENTGANGFEKGFSLTNGVDANLFQYVTGSATGDKRAFITAGAANQALTFGTLYTERMRIDSSGNVGIGTTIPASYSTKFAVVGGNIGISEEGATILNISANANVTTLSAFNATGSSLTFNTSSSGSGPVERMRIDSSGNVGIGTSSPGYKLDVNGTFGFTPGASVTPVDNGDVVFELTNNTTLTIKAKGSDGVVRSGTITLT